MESFLYCLCSSSTYLWVARWYTVIHLITLMQLNLFVLHRHQDQTWKLFFWKYKNTVSCIALLYFLGLSSPWNSWFCTLKMHRLCDVLTSFHSKSCVRPHILWKFPKFYIQISEIMLFNQIVIASTVLVLHSVEIKCANMLGNRIVLDSLQER